MLDARALEVEAAARSVDRERRRLNAEFAAKVGELGDAKERLEAQVTRLETKELQLRKEWASCVDCPCTRHRNQCACSHN